MRVHRRFLSAALLALATIGVGACFTTAPSAPRTTAPTYTSAEGRYSASFPDQPTHSDDQYDWWASPDESVVLAVGWSDYPTGYFSTHDLTAAYDEKLRQLTTQSVTVTASEDISVQGHPGREVSLDLGNGRSGTARMVFVDGRLYIALAVGATDADGKAFLDSFGTPNS
jgi:hypothetical protein